MEWTGQVGYGEAEMREWMVDGRPAGKTKKFGNFTFATIYGAGHFVSLVFPCSWFCEMLTAFFSYVKAPHDKPVESLVMISRWLGNNLL